MFASWSSDYVGLHDTTKAVGSKAERVLGANGELHTFTIPTRVRFVCVDVEVPCGCS